MYEVIADFGRGLESDRTARVSTKYKTVDRKVRPVAAPLPEGSESRIRGGASDPSLRDPATHLHRRDAPGAQNRWGRVPTTGGGGLVSENARKARESLRILTGRVWVRRPDYRGADGDIHGTACAVESQADSSTESSHPEVDGAIEAEI